jgi:hypothetical protein
MVHAALVAVIAKDAGRQLTTRVTVNAGGIDVEVSGNIFRQAALNTSHV